MQEINSETIEKAIYNLCIQANTQYEQCLYEKIYNKYNTSHDKDTKNKLLNILKNAQLASQSKRPLCQDTGQVIVFARIGQQLKLTGINLNEAINNGVKNAYEQNFYRKSVVKNALFDRTNTKTNTPAIIYTEIVPGKNIELNLLLKGAGSENYSVTKMFKPTSSKKEIFRFIKKSIISAGEKSCPPIMIGLGIGGTLDSAAVMSKKAFFKNNNSNEEKELKNELFNYLSDIQDSILDIKIETSQTHIACLPVAITLNCHSTRHASCRIENGKIIYLNNKTSFINLPEENIHPKEILTTDYESIRSLEQGENILLTGEIYTARDAAHQRIENYYQKNGKLPFKIKNKIIFYAGPCPAAPGEIIGPVGPTTSARMDKYCSLFYSQGILATIGKGDRSKKAQEIIKKHKGRYLSAQGGIACLLSKCVKSSEIAAFEDLETEAVRKLYIEKLPLKVEL